ncbi:transcription factor TFIIIB component B'' homolog isoform X3 [Aquila chrysaetos chrysaetos]|uniref:transcription factor TFIIIB component B'' homolog isoform X3 n=1 Tax=Aquila chrysaetos chrysaetos TaxID=223781 RepID=UPI001B7D4367|nr:transcription factor TFIIIB component B'' homolog isoform X3 [Aquila chrysaetos chrysaetos]
MFRRARLNVRPNVRPAGRGAGGAADPEGSGSGSPVAARAEAAAGAAAEAPPAARRAESSDTTDSSNDAGEASKPAEMPTQRRKRISTMPNLVKPRAGPSSAQCSASKPQRRASQAPDGSASLQKDSSPSEKSNVESSLKSPMLPEKKTPVPQVPQFSPLKKSVNKEQTVGVAAQKNDDTLQKNVPSPLKERPTQERSGAQEEKLPMKPATVKEKRPCSDRERILKARKLREMLKEELKKERMLKHRPPITEGHSPPDRSKMTMRDLIYYLPENNPMKSSLAEEKRTEKSSALGQMKEQEEKNTPHHEEEDEEEAENGEESQDSPLLAPRVKVAEDGSIILDEESLTVEVLRTKGPCVVEENDPIFERGSTTTYSSFRKSFYTKPWSNKETDMFFLAISMVGTDFSLIGRLFPHRARAEIKNKFKREEKANGWRIDKAFKEKRPFDFEFFAQLLEKVLADEEKRKQKTVKSQKPKEKKLSRPRKKPKAKAASTEAANDQDDLQEARISDAEADAVTAEKENEESLGVSEQAEQVALEPALAKKKRKKRRKDDLEQEVENLPEEMAVPSKIAEEGKSSEKTEKKVVCDANNDGHTTCREKLGSVTEENQDETAVTEEERSVSCLPVDDVMERENDVNLCSFEGSNDIILETESAKLRALDIRDDTSQESQISDLPVSEIRGKERESEETRETKNKDIHDLHRPDEKQSASESDSQSEIIKSEKPLDRGCLQRPKPNLVRSSGKREAATQEKMEAETSSPNLVNADKKCSKEDSRRNRNEATEVENTDLDSKSEVPEKTVIAKAIVRGCRQRLKPNVTRASGRKEEPGKDAGNDKMSHPQPKGETEKNTDQSSKSDATSEEAAEKDVKVVDTLSQSNERAGLQEESKQSVLKPTPLKRGRVQRPKPNLRTTVARQKDLTDEKDPEEEKTEGGEVEKGVVHHRDENNDPCLKNDVMAHEDTHLCHVMLEGDVSTDSEMNSIHARQCSQEKCSEAESCESGKGLSDVLKQVSDFNTGESGPRKEEEKTVVSSALLLRSRFQRPKPNLRMTTSRKEVLNVNNKGVSQKDTNKEESLTQCDSECNVLPDTDKAGKYDVLQPLKSLEKEKSLGSQEVSEGPGCKSPKTFSRSEDGELKFCVPEINQDDTSTTNAGKNTTEEESKQTPLQPVQLVRSRFQRYKPNLVRAVGKKELQISENEREEKPGAEQLVLQKDESANTIIGENEAVLCQADVSSKEEQEQQEAPQMPFISENVLCEQSSAEKSISQEGKLGALKPGQFIRNGSPRTRPDLARVYSEKESPVAQKLVAPVEEEANKGENLRVVEESEESLSSKDEAEVLLFVGNLAKNDNLDINPKSMKSEALCSSEKSPNCHSKGEQEHLSTDAIGSIQDSIERRSSCNDVQCPGSLVEVMLFMSNDILSSGEESKQNDTMPQAREPHWNPRPTLMRVTRKRDYPEEGENREEDNAENRNSEECLELEITGVSMQNSSNIEEAACFSEATRKHNFTDSVEETSCKRIRQDSRLQSPEISSESKSQVEQEDDSQLSTSQENSDNLTRRLSRRSSKWIALPKHVLELRTAASSASECEADCSEKWNQRQEVKLSVTRGKSLKTTHRRKSGKKHRNSKITLVTLRASQEEEEEEEPDDFEPDDEDECFAPEEVNKAPVFVPIGLRSPKPVPVQIEETMEELEIVVNIPDVQVATDVESLSHASVQPVVEREEKVNTSTAETTVHENPEVDKGINDGSTEAAMTLLAMGDPMFQLKTSTEEWTHMLPAKDELDIASSLVTHAYSKQNRTSSQYLLSSDTSTKESVPSEDGSNINVEDQSTGTRIGAEEYFEKNATDTSDSSLPTVNSMRLTRGRLLKPEPAFGVLRSNENIMQESLNTNVPVEQLEQVESESTALRGTAEMQKVELEQVRPAAGDSSVLHDSATRSVELIKQVDETERTEKEMRDACGNSGDLRAINASPKPEKSHLGVEDCPNQSSVDGFPEQNPCPPEHNIYTINFTQNEACAQDAQKQCVSSTEETSVVNDDHSSPEEEQTFILTLVEIPADSKEFDASDLLEQTPEPLLPAPIFISPISTCETSMTAVESTGSLTTAADEFAAPLKSNIETKQLESASVEPVPNSQTTQKRSAAELEVNDFPPAKKTLSTVAVERNLETTYKGYSIKSTNAPMIASGNPFQKTQVSAKEKEVNSVLVPESMSPLAERSQLQTLENLGKAPLENSASKQEEEVMSRLTSSRKAEISGQGKQGDVHESGQLEHTGSLASSSSKTPLLRGGRKPLGFLSLICKKSSSESAEDAKGNRGKIHKPRIVTPRLSLKKPTPSSKDDRESCFLPSTSTSSSVEDKNVAADAAVTVPSNKPSEKPPLCAKDQEKEEEPTRISEYFFSDIFMEVDDSE